MLIEINLLRFWKNLNGFSKKIDHSLCEKEQAGILHDQEFGSQIMLSLV